MSTCILAKKSLQNFKQAMAFAPGIEADAAVGGCKWSTMQAAA